MAWLLCFSVLQVEPQYLSLSFYYLCYMHSLPISGSGVVLNYSPCSLVPQRQPTLHCTQPLFNEITGCLDTRNQHAQKDGPDSMLSSPSSDEVSGEDWLLAGGFRRCQGQYSQCERHQLVQLHCCGRTSKTLLFHVWRPCCSLFVSLWIQTI